MQPGSENQLALWVKYLPIEESQEVDVSDNDDGSQVRSESESGSKLAAAYRVWVGWFGLDVS